MILLVLMLAFPVADPVSGCVMVRAENDGAGAGFVVDAKKNRILTCRHVVGDRDRADVFFPWRRDGVLVTEKQSYLGNRDRLRELGLLRTGKVIRKSDDADLALIELDGLPESARELKLAPALPCPGDPLRAVGCRIDLDTVFNLTTGPVRQTGKLANGYFWRGKKLAAGADAVLGQLPIEEGDSGGPVLNERGDVVGVTSALRRQTPLAAVAISAEEIRRFLNIEQPQAKPAAPNLGDTLMRATVWIRPTATDFRTAGVLISKEYIVTSNRGLGPAERLGVAFPVFENGRFVAEAAAYRDFVGLQLGGAWRPGAVVARDAGRDLALIRIADAPGHMRPVMLARQEPAVGDAVHSMGHPGGVEFAWVYSSGSIRQRGKLALAEGEKALRVNANLLQLPSQSSSPGGPVLNDAGELAGIITARESAQQTGYSVSRDELARFLDIARTDQAAGSLAGLVSRVEAALSAAAEALADLLALGNASEQSLRLAIALNPDSHRARRFLLLLLHTAGCTEEYAAELDRMADRPRCFPGHVFMRAVERMNREEWKPARADLDRILEILPSDALARRRLVRVLLELNKDDEAATAAGDAIRSDERGIRFLASDLIEQADAMSRKFPDTPSIPANWLKQAIGAGAKFDPVETRRKECAVVLKAAAAAPDDAARLRILREFLQTR